MAVPDASVKGVTPERHRGPRRAQVLTPAMSKLTLHDPTGLESCHLFLEQDKGSFRRGNSSSGVCGPDNHRDACSWGAYSVPFM